jgi:hypothetical protein
VVVPLVGCKTSGLSLGESIEYSVNFTGVISQAVKTNDLLMFQREIQGRERNYM